MVTHRSMFLRDIKEADQRLRSKINAAKNILKIEVKATLLHFQWCVDNGDIETAKRILNTVDYHARNGNDLLTVALLDNFYTPLRQSGFTAETAPIALSQYIENSLLSRDTVALKESLIVWQGIPNNDLSAEFKGLTLRAEDMGQGVWWTVDGIDRLEDNEHPLAPNMSAARKLAEKAARDYLGVSRPSFPDLSFEQEGVDLFGLTKINDKIRLVSLRSDGTYQIVNEAGTLLTRHSGSFIGTGSLLLPVFHQHKRLLIAIEEFEHLVNNRDAREADFQDFFIRHPDFILSDDYKKLHSQIILSNEDPKIGSLIPDFILEPHEPRVLSDILEVKLPAAKVVTLKKNRERFSSAVSEACAQLLKYGSFFEDPRHRERVKNAYGLHLYRPRLVLIIGRRPQMDPIILQRIQSSDPIIVKTYDDLLDRARRRLKIV